MLQCSNAGSTQLPGCLNVVQVLLWRCINTGGLPPLACLNAVIQTMSCDCDALMLVGSCSGDMLMQMILSDGHLLMLVVSCSEDVLMQEVHQYFLTI